MMARKVGVCKRKIYCETCIQVITLANGKTTYLYKGYTYYKKTLLKDGSWRCYCTARANCKARLFLSHDGRHLHTTNAHLHQPKKYFRPAISTKASPHSGLTKITLVNGKDVYMYRGYTYYVECKNRSLKRWRCTKACKAYLTVDVGKVTPVHEHSHPPSKYYKMPSDPLDLRRKRGMWSPKHLSSAVRAVKAGQLSTRRAAQLFCIPRRTIRRYLESAM
ncbi:hypothetical protein ACJJTC_012588 [Scirpophaga incertulas]